MDIEQARYAFSQFVIAVFKLASGSQDLTVRLQTARDELRRNVTPEDLPDDLKGSYASIVAADLDTLDDRELVSLAGKMVSFAFALLEVISKWEATRGIEPPARTSFIAEEYLSLDGGAPLLDSGNTL